ncbi:CPI1 inhibitor, partial [Atlantisia rogersi]|nr:CPI1 inhibitor [Atlantisia rogersi]
MQEKSLTMNLPTIFPFFSQVKPQFESRENRTCGIFKAIVYKTQVVAGINYFIKVQVSDNNYVHIRVFQSLPQENEGPRLVSYQTGKTRDDPLTYF